MALPKWPAADKVYSKAYRILERMGRDGHVRGTGKWCSVGIDIKGRAIMGHPMCISNDMDRLVKALDKGDEEEIKGLLLLTHVYHE